MNNFRYKESMSWKMVRAPNILKSVKSMTYILLVLVSLVHGQDINEQGQGKNELYEIMKRFDYLEKKCTMYICIPITFNNP